MRSKLMIHSRAARDLRSDDTIHAGRRAGRSKARSVTFNRDVLPILQKNCQVCHRPGEIAPMSFLTYQDARPWAKSMKAAVIARQDASMVRGSRLWPLQERPAVERCRNSSDQRLGRQRCRRR